MRFAVTSRFRVVFYATSARRSIEKETSRCLAATIRLTKPPNRLAPAFCSSFSDLKFAGFLRDFDLNAIARAASGKIDLRITDAKASNLNLVNI